ncbi:MAG: hypothetical protein Q8873_00620 [Bacillota bacterium]|nr:hypothetical protein [Bacillota bacterium]
MSTDAKRKANAEWEKRQDRILLRLPKGYKDIIKSRSGQNPGEYINKLIDQDMNGGKD